MFMDVNDSVSELRDSRRGGGGGLITISGGAKNTFWICMGCLLGSCFTCLSEWEKVCKFRFDIFSVGSQNLNIMRQGKKS